jgi:malonyl CoA-acyl carrier protein transacylase
VTFACYSQQAVTTAIVFPGQGSQKPGMARDFHTRYAASREVFAEASEAVGLDLAALCFEEDPRLDQTEFTQPALLTAEIAMIRALQTEHGLQPSWYGGHSLGEYTALCAAGVIPLGIAVRLVRTRGALMQQAVPLGTGAMAAVIADGIAERDLSAVLAGLEVDVGNRNSPNQLVLSGAAADVERASARCVELLAGVEHQVVPLNVSAPFHSRMMRGIEPAFRAELEAVGSKLDVAKAPAVTSNLTGGFHRAELAAVIDGLTKQISGAVDWIGNMRALAGAAKQIYEVGPNRPLRGFFKTLGRDVTAILTVKAVEKGLPA